MCRTGCKKDLSAENPVGWTGLYCDGFAGRDGRFD